MTKLACYKKLFEIRDTYQVDITEQLHQLAVMPSPDESIITFISRYNSSPSFLNEEVVENIYNKRDKNPLYKSLVNESASDIDKAIAMSSLITRVLIDSKSMTDNKSLLSEMQIHSLTSALSDYANGDTSSLLATFDNIRSQVKSIINNRKVR